MRWAGGLGMVFHTRYVPCRNVRFAAARRVHRPRCTAVVGLPGRVRRIRWARPILPTIQTVHPTRVHRPTYPISREQPAHHWWAWGTASAASYAATFVPQSLVRGGVLDAPPLRDRRGGLDADVGHDQPHPSHLRCIRLVSTAQRIQSRGHSPRTISYGRPT